MLEEIIINQQSKVVLIDNYCEDLMTINNLLKIINGCTFRKIRKGTVVFKPEIVYITCLYPPERCLHVYNGNKVLTKSEQLKIEELKKRITSLIHLEA